MSTSESTGPSATCSGERSDDTIDAPKETQTEELGETETPRGREYLAERLPPAPPIPDDTVEVLNLLDVFYIHCFVFNLISNLAELLPQDRLNVQEGVPISDVEVFKILADLIDECLLDDLLDNCDLLWDNVISPRMSLQDIETLIQKAIQHQRETTAPVENVADDDIGDIETGEEFEERDLDDSYSDDGLMYYDDENFEWPLKTTPAWKQGIKDRKAREKAAKNAPVLELFAELDRTLTAKFSAEPEQESVEITSGVAPPELQMPTLSMAEMNEEASILYGTTNFDGWIDGPCCPLIKSLVKSEKTIGINELPASGYETRLHPREILKNTIEETGGLVSGGFYDEEDKSLETEDKDKEQQSVESCCPAQAFTE
ncbi:hypothetical protein AA313_de0204197 [Arthrobotrys entomopaga]|nr:hypothetical protein AA313_de0204197 [Arthrobotrys entomopaga]